MKKFLSILAAVGLTATSSTAVVACSSSPFNSGTLKINGVDDLAIAYDGVTPTSALDKYISNRTDWRANNNQYANEIETALTAYDRDQSQDNLDALNVAAYKVVVPIFKANDKYSLSAQELYNDMNIDIASTHDKATTQNKMELKVQFIQLGDIYHAVGVRNKDGKVITNIANALDITTGKSGAADQYQVNLRGPEYIKSTFGQNIDGDKLQYILNRPDKSVHGMKLEVVTNPEVIIDSNDRGNDGYAYQSDGNTLTVTGINLNKLTAANTKVLYANGDEVKDSDGNNIISQTSATREDYRSTVITFSSKLSVGEYTLQFTPDNGAGVINVHFTVTTSASNNDNEQ